MTLKSLKNKVKKAVAYASLLAPLAGCMSLSESLNYREKHSQNQESLYEIKRLNQETTYIGFKADEVKNMEDAKQRVLADKDSGFLFYGFSNRELENARTALNRYITINPNSLENLEPVIIKIEENPRDLVQIHGLTISNNSDLETSISNTGNSGMDILRERVYEVEDFWKNPATSNLSKTNCLTVEANSTDSWDTIYFTGNNPEILRHEIGHAIVNDNLSRLNEMIDNWDENNSLTSYSKKTSNKKNQTFLSDHIERNSYSKNNSEIEEALTYEEMLNKKRKINEDLAEAFRLATSDVLPEDIRNNKTKREKVELTRRLIEKL